MPKIKVKGQTVQPGEHGQTHKRTDGRTLPSLSSSRFAVDNERPCLTCLLNCRCCWSMTSIDHGPPLLLPAPGLLGQCLSSKGQRRLLGVFLWSFGHCLAARGLLWKQLLVQLWSRWKLWHMLWLLHLTPSMILRRATWTTWTKSSLVYSEFLPSSCLILCNIKGAKAQFHDPSLTC